MSEDIFDAIIVGAGLAGSVAALVLAREGAQVLVIERGNSAGAKNVTGGRLYAHSLEHIIPGFADSAPVERLITHEKLAFMTEKSAMTMDYCNGDETSPSQRSYSVLRSKFDAWLMEQAEEAGAQLITGIRVDNLVQRDGKVVGVEADGDVIEAKTVILADGVNSILAEKLGMAKRVKPTDVAVGVKELIELPKSVIEDRFQLQGNQGAACLFAGSPTDGLMGGGFLYTNENTLSLGLVCGLHHLHDAKKSVPQMLEDFKQHPAVAPLIAGGKLVEYSAHVVPEAGINMLPELVGDGVLIAGDAAGMCMNLGFTIRGMDLAIAAGEAAAKTVLSAMKSDDFSKQKLAEYRQHLESGPLRDMRIAEGVPNRVQVDTHKLLRDVARTDATCGILAHNHPTGLAVPSEADMIATMGIMQALGPLGVSIIDHIIVAGEDACSMRDRGCLPMYRAGRDTLNAASRY